MSLRSPSFLFLFVKTSLTSAVPKGRRELHAGDLNIGDNNNHWQYDPLGRLKSIPGYITGQTYVLDGQTKAITYANGVTAELTYSLARRWLISIKTVDVTGKFLINSLYTRDGEAGERSIQ